MVAVTVTMMMVVYLERAHRDTLGRRDHQVRKKLATLNEGL
jgi:hypothetical protein